MSRSIESISGPLKIAVLDDFQQVALKMADWGAVADAVITSFADHLGNPAALVERLKPFDVVCMMRERTPISGEILAQLPNLKLIVTTGMWNAALDIEDAQRREIAVSGCTAPQSGTPELTWLLIMALARHLPQELAAMRTGLWQTGVGGDLEGSTLGILGLGHIGSRVARFGQAFGMRVVAWSQNLTEAAAAAVGTTRVDKEELLRSADFVTLHMKLSDRSRGMVGETELSWMKPTAYLVNTSRGPLVSEPALMHALRQGRIAGAALDVFDREPLAPDHPLRQMPNVILTPHIGYVTERTYRDFFRQVVENIVAWQQGKMLRPLTSNRLPQAERKT